VPGKKFAHKKFNYAKACPIRNTQSQQKTVEVCDGAPLARSIHDPTGMEKT